VRTKKGGFGRFFLFALSSPRSHCTRIEWRIGFSVHGEGFALKLRLSFLIASLFIVQSASALEWRWSYDGEGIAASGMFTTSNAPDADGFYEITGISGEANGVAITGLQAPGTSIPGNDGYPVDNLVSAAAPQLSKHGFGYALASGAYANPFYGAHFVPPGYYDFFSDPKAGKTSEREVTFSATTTW
jgi:hypothetical protein